MHARRADGDGSWAVAHRIRKVAPTGFCLLVFSTLGIIMAISPAGDPASRLSRYSTVLGRRVT